MNRRDFLKGVGGLALAPGLSGWVSADASAATPTFLMVFLRGGADGLHLVAPAADPLYIAARPADLRILAEGDKAGPLLSNSYADDLGFRLHPGLAPLLPLYQARQLAIVHAAGLTNATRSHFVAQDMMERGVATEKEMAETTGWLGRAQARQPNILGAFSATGNPVFGLRGASSYLAAPDLNNGVGFPYGDNTRQLLEQWSTGGSAYGKASADALKILGVAAKAIVKGADGKTKPYASAGALPYAEGADFGRRLSAVAQLIQADLGLRAAWVDYGGWDTHEGQGGRMNELASRLGAGLAAFHDDMAQARRPVVVVVFSEFGRRFRSNKSNGTDHGHGGVAFVLGNDVPGGQCLGHWPGLETRQLDEGVDLAVTTDYRSILTGALQLARLPSSFPGWQGKPLFG